MKHIKYISLRIVSLSGDSDDKVCVRVTCTSRTRNFVMYFTDDASVSFYQYLYSLINKSFNGFVKYIRLTLGRVLSVQCIYLDRSYSDSVHLKSLSLDSDFEVWLLSECDYRLFEHLKPKLI